MPSSKEAIACTPIAVDPTKFNPSVDLPFGLTVNHVNLAMTEFVEFLGFVNSQLHKRRIERLESFLMPANFSSIVGEFTAAAIPKYCNGIVRNNYHNGHPDLIPRGRYTDDAAQHANEGVEIKASRHLRGWQGHNPEDVWLMVFVFDANASRDVVRGAAPKPFRFVKVVGGMLTKDDWTFSGRSETSRRTITASINRSGFQKMEANWIYRSEQQ